MKSGISIIVPCLNESGNIASIFEKIRESLNESTFEIIFVDDGSTDSSAKEFIEVFNKADGKVQIVTHKINLGIPRAWKSGLAVAKYEMICLIDGDLQNPPEAIIDLIQSHVENQCDVVQGTRSPIGRTKNERLIFSRGLNLTLNFIFKQNASDSKSGFLVAKRYVLEDVFCDIEKFKHFQTFIGVAIRSRGYHVIEKETLFMSREVGSSFLTSVKIPSVLAKTFMDLLRGIVVYGRKVNGLGFLSQSKPIDNQLTFFRRMRFELFFSTMPLHKWIIGKRTKSLYLWLKRIEFSPKSDLETLQLRRLQRLLMHAYTTVPFYKRAFDNVGFKPNELSSLSDIAKLPLLSKSQVRKNIHFSMFSESHNKREMQRISTSGSTGEPFICYADKFQLEMRFATTMRALEMTGYRFGDKQLRLWHQTLGMSASQVIRERLDAILLRRKFVPAFEMTDESIGALVKLIERGRYKLIDGYAESLNFISTMTNSTIKNSPKGIISSAQQLTPNTRRKIETIFGAQVYDKYGSREFSGIAYQCDQNLSHHVQDESYIVEILIEGRPALPGEVGEIVITDLNNFSVPLIRYRIGDLAVAVAQDPCNCRRPHSLIGEITGRTQAMVGCANGVWLPGGFFGHFFKDYEYCIKHYQIVQEIFGAFILKIVPRLQFTENAKIEILESLYAYAGANTIIEVEIVDSIPLVRTGKRSPVISNLRPDLQLASNIISNPKN